MKKILSLTLVLVLVLGSFPMAFADGHMSSSFSDVEDEDVSMALDRLSTFGIVDGYDDGTYKPDNMVTRAEFAKLLVTALGLENASSAATGSSEFTDVMGTEWYAGFVNVAAGEGIVGGYPDGSFKPNATVNYGEAVTMLVRALGYKDEFLPGSWPSNYVSKAARLDITDDVTFFPTGESDRGSVAVLLNNTLDSYVIKQDSFGDDNNWVEQDGQDGREKVTLLEDSLDLDKSDSNDKNVVSAIPEVNSSLDDDEFMITDEDNKEVQLEAGNENVSMLANDLFGVEVVYYTNDADEVEYIEKSDIDKSKVIYATVDKDGDFFDDSGDELTLLDADGDDTDYELADNGSIFVDNQVKDESNLASNFDDTDDANNGIDEKLFGKFVINSSNEIALANLHQFDKMSAVVTEADEDAFSYFYDDEGETVVEADDYDKIMFMDIEGNSIAMDELEDDDVLYLNDEDVDGDALINQSTDDELLVGIVVRNTVEGEGEKWKTDEFAISDVDYDIAGEATLSIDDNDEIVTYPDTDKLNDITDADAEVNVLLDLVGEIRHIRSDVDSSSDEMYGVISDISWDVDSAGNVDEVQDLTVLNHDGDEVTYKLDYDVEEFYAAETVLAKNDVIAYELNGDGEMDKAIKIGDVDVSNDDNAFDTSDVTVDSGLEINLSEDFDDNQIKTSGTDYVVDSDVTVLDLRDGFDFTGTDSFDGGDVSSVKYEDIVDDGSGNDVLIYTNSDDEAVFIALIDKLAVDDYETGYVLDDWNDDGTFVEVVLEDGSVEEYEVDNLSDFTDEDRLKDEIAISFVKNSDGTIDIYDVPEESVTSDTDYDLTAYAGEIIDVDSDKFTIATEVSTTGAVLDSEVVYKDSDTIYYMDDGEQDYYDLDEHDFVYLIADGKYAKVVQEFDGATTTFINSFNYLTDGAGDIKYNVDDDDDSTVDEDKVVSENVTYIEEK